MSRYFSAAALLGACAFAAACGAGAPAPLAPAANPGVETVNTGGGSGAGQAARDDRPTASEVEFTARIEAFDAGTRALVVAGRAVTVPETATIRNGSATAGFDLLVPDTLVEVIGTEIESAVTARRIEMLRDPQVQLQGNISDLAGTASAFEFTLHGRRVTGSAVTEFTGGPAPSFAGLVDGAKVHVKALDKGSYAAAERIVLQDLDEEVPDVADVEITGVVAAISGDAPALTLTVGDATVLTTSATVVRIRNQTLAVSDLRVGQRLGVSGTAGEDGAVVAKRIQIEEVEPAPVPDPETEPAPAPQPFEATGLVTAVTGACPAASFVLQGKTIGTNISTKYVQLTCGGIIAGTKVRVKGTVAGDGPATAEWIKKEK